MRLIDVPALRGSDLRRFVAWCVDNNIDHAEIESIAVGPLDRAVRVTMKDGRSKVIFPGPAIGAT